MVLKEIRKKDAKHYVTKYHYTHNFPNGTLICYGVWIDTKFQGVVCYGFSAAKNHAVTFKCKQTEILELTRLWLYDAAPKNSESKAIAISRRLLKKKLPYLKHLISYADKSVGHEGIIYKASGWKFIRVGAKTSYYEINGKRIHSRTLGAKYGQRNLEYLREKVGKDLKVIKEIGKNLYHYKL